MTYIKQQNDLPATKKKYPEYKWVYSKVLQGTLRKLDEAYKSFFALWKKGDKDARPPRFKGKAYFTTMCYNQSGFKIEGNTIQWKVIRQTPRGEVTTEYKGIVEGNTMKGTFMMMDNEAEWTAKKK